MGQRLNIEIKKNNKIVANSYYHWSAYSKESLQLAKKIIDKYEEVKEDNDILYAIRLLGLSGAGITREGISYLYKNIPNFDISETLPSDNPFSQPYKWVLARGRDDGLVGFTEEDINETRSWEEGRITLDMDNKTFDFNVFGTTDELYEDSKVVDLDFRYNNIPFSEIDNYIKYIDDLIKGDETGTYYKVPDIDDYVYFIY